MASSFPKIVVAMIGARRRYAVPRIFDAAGWLAVFFTDFYIRSNILARWMRSRPGPEWFHALGGRHADDLNPRKVRPFFGFALQRAARAARAHTEAQRWRAFAEWNRHFARLVAAAGWKGANAVYVFNAAGLEILQRAGDEGLIRFVDQTTIPWSEEQRILSEERERWPGWERGAVYPSDWMELAERERAEWNLAEVILCGSEAVRDALVQHDVNAARCHVVPYGVAPELDMVPVKEEHDGPLRVLFVGTLELRKGVPYLLEAARRLPRSLAVFRVVGPSRLSDSAMKEVATHMEVVGPRSRVALERDYVWADVLVLPTLAEGSANVCYEAMAHRLPVITTPAAGSQVRDGADGFIVPARQAEVLAERLETLARRRDLLRAMSDSAFEQSRRFDLEHYASRLTAVVNATYEHPASACEAK